MAGQGESALSEGMEQNEMISAVCSDWKTVGEIILLFHCQWPGVTCFAAKACLWLALSTPFYHVFIKFQGEKIQIIF